MAFLLQPGLAYRPAPGVNASEHMRTLRAYLWNKSGGLCALCRLPIEIDKVHADHIAPKSKGGSDAVYNLQAAHERCNASKGDRTDDEAPTTDEDIADARWTSKAGQPIDKLLQIFDIATYMSVTKRDVLRWLESGEMKGIFLGKPGWRVHESEVFRFLESRRDE